MGGYECLNEKSDFFRKKKETIYKRIYGKRKRNSGLPYHISNIKSKVLSITK